MSEANPGSGAPGGAADPAVGGPHDPEHDPHAAAAENFRVWLAGSRFDAPTDEGDRRRERILTDLHLLRGKDLACTCPPDRVCHGDVLLHRANMPAAELQEWIRGVRARVDWHRVNDGDSPLHPTP